MIVKNPKFEISAVKPAQYPKNGAPEIVLQFPECIKCKKLSIYAENQKGCLKWKC